MYRNYSVFQDWAQDAEDMGFEIHLETDENAVTLATDRIASEEVGLWSPMNDYGILFDNPNDFARWVYEGTIRAVGGEL